MPYEATWSLINAGLTAFMIFPSTTTFDWIPLADWSHLFLVCVLICLDRWSLLINFFKHSGHWKRFSPVCVLLCRCNSSDLVNRLPQKSHWQTNGLSPACHRRWARRWDVFPYTLPQPGMWHRCCFFFSPLFLRRYIDNIINERVKRQW